MAYMNFSYRHIISYTVCSPLGRSPAYRVGHATQPNNNTIITQRVNQRSQISHFPAYVHAL